MPYRAFIDSGGSEWQVWDVVPRLSERRTSQETDRRLATIPIPFADRRRDSRRMTQVRRAILRGSYAQGWLCFDNGREKRRLTPIPADWTTCSERSLEGYSSRAESVPGAHRIFEYGDDNFAEAG